MFTGESDGREAAPHGPSSPPSSPRARGCYGRPVTSQPKWMIYGANGYTGRLIAAEAAARGMRPILAGRRREAVAAVAGPRGLPVRAFDLDDPQAIARALADVDLVLHCAGPFLDTAKPMLAACQASGTHYLDIAGEIPVYERVMRRRDELAAAGVVAIPGVGFDVLPSDCLVRRLKDTLPTATRLELAIRLDTRASPGTARTFVHALPVGGVIREAGALKVVPPAWRTRSVDFGDGPERVMSVALADVSSAFHASGFTDIEAYIQVHAWQLWAFRLSRPVRFLLIPRPVRDLVGKVAARLHPGPGDAERSQNGARVWARAGDPEGRSAALLLRGPDGYEITVDAALCATAAVLAGEVAPGGYTPAMAFGAGFLDRLRGISVSPAG